MVTMVDPTGNRSAARSASGSSQIWVYTRRRNQNAKSLSQIVASASPLVLRTASAISCVFIHPPNQQSDKGIATSLQFSARAEPLRPQNYGGIRPASAASHPPVAQPSEGIG